MPWVTTEYRMKYKGKFYEAGEKISVSDEDLPALLESGANQTSPARGRPKGRTREDKALQWDEI